MKETVKAYAKINLHLDIKSKRPDGYHDVETVMQTVSLCDTVTVTPCEKYEFVCECNVKGVPTDDKNIAVRAARLFAEATGIKRGAHIYIEKNIPMAAGMAGGSSDGAATLRALNRLYNNPLSETELEEIGSALGADVPFCIRGGTEGVTGIGFNFLKVCKPPKFIYLIACGEEGISTPLMYKEYDLKYSPPLNDHNSDFFQGRSEKLRLALEKGEKEEIFSSMFNCFEEIAQGQIPKIKEIKNIMNKHNAKISMMSGSGPSVFGIFENAENAEEARKEISSLGADAFIVFDQ